MAYRTSKAAAELASLATLSPLVIATRMTNLWLTAGSPTAQLQKEANLMVTEKLQAIAESAIAMNMAVARIGVETAFAFVGSGTRPSDFMGDWDRVAAAGLKPYTAKVRANRKRLSNE